MKKSDTNKNGNITAMNFTAEMIEKAKAAKTAEDLYEIAKANGVEMTADEAVTYFAQLNPTDGELGDDELGAVAGGGCNIEVPGIDETLAEKVRVTSGQTCKKCGTNIGKLIESGRFYKSTYVWCDPCGQRIAYDSDCTYEIIS